MKFSINILIVQISFIGLLSSIVIPPVPFLGIEFYLTTIVSVFLIIILLFNNECVRNLNISFLFPLLFGFMVIFSSMISWSSGISKINLRDIIESIKYFQYFPFLLISPKIIKTNLVLICRLIHISAGLVAIVGIIQVLDVNYVNNFITKIYIGSDSVHLESVFSGERITTTGSDPNVGAIICSFFCIYFISKFYFKMGFINLLFASYFVFLLFMTQSRTALVAIILCFFIWLFFYARLNLFLKIITVFIVTCVLLFVVLSFDFDYIILGFTMALEGTNTSLLVRFINLDLAFDRFLTSPIFGVGPAKSEFETSIDSEYALIVQRYGLIGILLFSVYLIYLLRIAVVIKNNLFANTLFMFIIFSIIMMATNNIFSGYQVMSFIIILHLICNSYNL